LRADYVFVKIDINASRKNKQHPYIVLHYVDNRFSSFVFQETERKKKINEGPSPWIDDE